MAQRNRPVLRHRPDRPIRLVWVEMVGPAAVVCYNVLSDVPPLCGRKVVNVTVEPRPFDVDDAYRLYKSGKSLTEAARVIGTTFSILEYSFLQRGFALRTFAESQSNRFARERAEWVEQAPGTIGPLYARYLAGESPRSITGTMDKGRSLLRQFKMLGWPTRGRSEANWISAAGRSAEERQRRVGAAHDASRGRVKTEEEGIKAALTRERLGIPGSAYESTLYNMLAAKGLVFTRQKAIGQYSVDLASGTVAVETTIGWNYSEASRAARHHRRTRYLLDLGWNVLVILIEQRRYHLLVEAADYVVSLVEFARANPTAIGQYRVIRGTGQEIVLGCAQDDQFPLKPARKATDAVRCEHHLAGG